MKKKGNKGMPTAKQKLIHNPIPTSLLFVCIKQLVPAVSLSNRNVSERNKDVGMGL